jgi:beta-galactosidase
LGNSRTSWGAKSVEACLAADVEHPYTLGQFVWSGFDYIGEPTPYHTKNSYLGQIDTAGFPKDSFYRYQAGWTDYRAKPMVHLLPYWDFNEGQIIDICVISNAPEVALWVNGVSQGRQKLDTVSQISAHWQAPYHPGSLMAVAYDETGREIARTEERSFGDAAKLTAQVDRTHLAGDGRELVFCAISAVDQDGNPVRNANNRVTVEAMGALTLLGLDNGDSADLDEYKCTTRQLFSGQLLAVAAGRSAGGMGALEITSPGMEPVRVPVMVTPCPQEEGAAPPLPLWLGRAPEQIPVRKIDLTATGQQMTPERPSVEVEARLLPENATLRQVAWRVSDAMGITANGVVLEVLDETHVRLTGVGDGEYRLRCTCNNGREAPQLISTLEVAVSGMGTRYPDPYDYISASHYDHSHGEIGNGNERGIATSRTEMSWVAYDRLDFGKAGADTLTLDVFEMNSLPTPIRFWRGQPYAPGSVMIGEKIYDKPSQWNVYQPETFTLEQRLQGVETLGIELQCKVHLKGFQFARRSRAWDVLPALSRDTIYGDSYQEGERAVCGIGNNVSLIFQGLDFGTVGFRTLTIRGRTPLANNTIHVLFHGPEGESRRILEFAHQADWGDQRFALEPVYGVQDVTFLFLPGSNFDFEQFQFEL